jgi:ParE toxin of type II toxin-antitoxin system, parDE
MVYKVVVENQAELDIDQAIEYYKALIDYPTVVINLLLEIDDAYRALAINPFFQVRHKHYRALPLKKYPYLMFFEVFEDERIVKIISLFQTDQDHQKWV